MIMNMNKKDLFLQCNDPSPTRSLVSSFTSNSSWDSSPMVYTPNSESSFDRVKPEDASYCTPARSSSSMSHSSMTLYDSSPSFMDLPISPHGTMPVFQDTSLITGTENMGYTKFDLYDGPMGQLSCHGLPTDTSFMDDYSPSTPQDSVNCVAPSQTTFMNNFDLQSPMRSMTSAPFEFQYDSPQSDFVSDSSFGYSPTDTLQDLNIDIKYSYSNCSSASSTPSRYAVGRPRVFEELSSSAALQCAQEMEFGRKAIKSEKLKSRKDKRELRHSKIPSTIQVEVASKNPCPMPGCSKIFKRREHLKRHVNTTHRLIKDFACSCCGKGFNRVDNLVSHLNLHLKPPTKGSRTVHKPEAQQQIDELQRESRKGNAPNRIHIQRTRTSPRSILL